VIHTLKEEKDGVYRGTARTPKEAGSY